MFDGLKSMFGFGNNGLSRNRGMQQSAPYISSDDIAAPVNFDSAMAISAVWAAVRLQSETVASLPLKFYKTENDRRVVDNSTDIAKLLNGGKVNRYQDLTSFLESIVVNLMTYGNFYGLPVRNTSGNLVSILPLNSAQVETELLSNGNVVYHYSDANGRRTYQASEIWHIKLWGNSIEGLSPLDYARQTLGIARAANNRTAKTFRNAGKRSGVLMTPTQLNDEQRQAVRQNYSALQNGDSDELFVLDADAKFQPLALTPADQELLENRRFSVVEIARVFGIPPVLLHSMDNTTTLGSSTTEIINSYYKLSLRPLLNKIEESIRVNFMTPAQRRQIFAHFDLDELLRPLPGERWQNWKTAVESGVMTPNEVRAKENLPRVDGTGDELLANSALKPIRDIERGDTQAKTE